MAFASLQLAAQGIQATMFTRYAAGTLSADQAAFNSTVSALLPDQDPNSRTVGNWLVLLQAYQQQFSASSAFTNDGESLFVALASTMYRLIWQTINCNTTGQISGAQATAILAAINANLA